ncbi:MAG: shikimate dehydrogenase [Anaerolineae bacterium]|nr:shikimate dehydrogenase [Anaerolineae bacterium]
MQEYFLGLVGYPIEHSLSPKLHNLALSTLDIPGTYALYPCPPTQEGQETLLNLLNKLRNNQLHGLNITVPLKQTIIPLLDDMTSSALAVGAVNTIYLENGNLMGDNTDAPGFLADLQSSGLWPQSGTGTALILGAGGGASAAAYGLAAAGWELFIAARRIEQANSLITLLGKIPNISSKQLLPISLQSSSLHPIINNCDLVINTTPVGMYPNINDSPWPKDLALPANTGFYDLIYNPSESKLLTSAKAVGLPTRNGLGMLVEQAALSFEIWTGKPAPRTAMYTAITGQRESP